MSRSFSASSGAMLDSSSITSTSLNISSNFYNSHSSNLSNSYNSNSISISNRLESDISIDYDALFCNDLNIESADRHMLNKYVIYRLNQYKTLNSEDYDL